MRPATSGSVLYDGRDLYANYAELRHRIGLVPQENILHTQLSARRGLSYAAELRFPQDTTPAERSRRVDEVLGELSLARHADTRTGSLSGGQQKRVNVALELLTKPSLLFLDEPTSGLDPGLDKSVMEMLAQLAKDGRTVMVVTHSVANLASCDRLLVLVPGGKVAYFGTPADGLRHFGHDDWAEVFQDFEAQPDRDWAADYRRSAYYARYTSGPLQALGAAEARPDASAARAVAAPPPRPASRLAQLSTLVRRYLSVIASDRNYVGVIALLPVILGGLIRAIPDAGGLVGPSNGLAIQLLLILVMSACLIGVANAVRELVKERAIYTRERAAGLSPAAYLASKLVVLGVISAVQSVVLVAIGLAGRPMPAARRADLLPARRDHARRRRPRHRLDDRRPAHLGRGQLLGQDPPAPGRHGPGGSRTQRRRHPPQRQRRPGAARLAHPVPLGLRRRRVHHRPQPRHPAAARRHPRPAVEPLGAHLGRQHGPPAGLGRRLRPADLEAAAPARPPLAAPPTGFPAPTAIIPAALIRPGCLRRRERARPGMISPALGPERGRKRPVRKA